MNIKETIILIGNFILKMNIIFITIETNLRIFINKINVNNLHKNCLIKT